MRSKIVVANWKMHKDLGEGLRLATEVIQMLHNQVKDKVQVILLPPFIHLEAISKLLPTAGPIHLGAQNCHEHAFGAFTGEIAAPMLRSVGASFVLIGHSERRHYFGEGSALLAQKVSIALIYGLRPIFCCGEVEQTCTVAWQENFVEEQLATSLFHLSAEQIAQVIVAYEPVWAIGTGRTPTPTQAQAMHQFIRYIIASKYGEEVASSIPILYGGSCDTENARLFFTRPDVDGGLIGKASLIANSFVTIVKSLE
ncbi:MAG: triose-phosphate isomerase [Amoebophilaceae bacterium]|nr:triose-phosphate isomerase [Amoebophilaceae bacterium]